MKLQIAKTVFLINLSIMKKILDLLAFKLGKNTDDYKYVKRKLMDYIYKGTKKIFKQLLEENILKHCDCKATLRQGYTECEFCSGCGFKNIN